ncbi:NADH-ubiquinone oxidoreductase 64 kDa subunit [Apiospora arundinis]
MPTLLGTVPLYKAILLTTSSLLCGLAFKHGKDPETLELSFNDWRNLASDVLKRFPQAVAHLRQLDKLFNDFDKGSTRFRISRVATVVEGSIGWYGIARVQFFEQGNAASATTQYEQSRLVFHGSFRIGVIVVDQDVCNG